LQRPVPDVGRGDDDDNDTELNGSHNEGLFEQMYEIAVGQPSGFVYVDVHKQRYFATFKNEFLPKRIEAHRIPSNKRTDYHRTNI
jgi:hypothetical protein